MRQDQSDNESGDRFANGVGGLHEAESFAAMLGAPGFGDERGGGGPFAAHAESEEEAEGGELGNAVGEAAGGTGDGVDEDGSHEGARAANAVRDDAEEKTADGGRGESEGVEQAGGGSAHGEFADEIGEDEGIEHDVHGIEHPAEAAGDEGFAFRRRNIARPAEEIFCRRRGRGIVHCRGILSHGQQRDHLFGR